MIKKRFSKSVISLILVAMMTASVFLGNVPVNAATNHKTTKTFESRMKKLFNGETVEFYNGIGARWWLCEGLHTDKTLKESVKELAGYGIKEVELVTLTENGVESSRYGCFSKEWWDDCKLVIKEAAKYGMAISLTSGANWATTNVPGITPDEDDSSQQLDYVMQNVKAGNKLQSEIKKPTPKSSAVKKVKLVKVVASKLVNAYDASAKTNSIDESTTVDITAQCTETDTGVKVDWTAPEGTGEWAVFSFWQYGTAQTGEPSVKTSYTVNYLEKSGAKAFTDYYDKNIFTDSDLVDAIKKNGHVSIFMDSMELSNDTGVFWSDTFLDEFKTRKGYDLTPYLPILIHGAVRLSDGKKTQLFPLKDTDKMEQVLNDTYDVYTQIYEENYLTPIREWCHTKGMKLRAQMSYASNQNLEATEPAKDLDYQETETLNADDQPDIYREQAGGAHVYNKVFSSETGALWQNMMLSPVDYLQMIYTEFASGVNRVILHGYSSQYGAEGATEWPGHIGILSIANSEQWNKRQPASKDYSYIFKHVTRLQTALQAGKPQMDVALLSLNYHVDMTPDFYYRQDDLPGGGKGNDSSKQLLNHVGTKWKDLTLQNKGYTYDFLSPNILLDEKNCAYSDGVLASNGPSYQAVVIWEKEMPYNAAKKILEMAKKGMKVVILDDAATKNPYNDGNDDKLKAVIANLKTLSNVTTVSTEAEVASALTKLNVTPRAAFAKANDQIMTVMRKTNTENYLYLYDYATDRGKITTEMSVKGRFKPYVVNTWSGDVREDTNYYYKDGRTYFNVTMDYGDVQLYVLRKVAKDTSVHQVNGNANLIINDGKYYIQADKSGTYKAKLSDGSAISKKVTVPKDITLSNWHLSVEDWKKGEWISRTETKEGADYTTKEGTYATKKDKIEVDLKKLKAWKDIPEIGKDVSGIGTYSTTLTLPKNWDKTDGAVIKFGEVKGTAKVVVNGKEVVTDLNSWQADISDYVKAGANKVQIVVTTPLINRVATSGLLSMWLTRTYTEEVSHTMIFIPKVTDEMINQFFITSNGLVNPVTVDMYKTTEVKTDK